jgi:hypothetical protein
VDHGTRGAPAGGRAALEDGLIYLTGASGHPASLARLGVGFMLQPRNGYLARVQEFPCWAADNGCFSQGDRFSVERWLAWLDRVPRERCLFAVAPDVFPSATGTYERSTPLLPLIRERGFRPAYVAQNDAEQHPLPWDAFDCLFLGATDEWKLGARARDLVREARDREKWVHMGRVNSERRLRYATLIGCDSSDGTFLRFANRQGKDGMRRLAAWFSQLVLPL